MAFLAWVDIGLLEHGGKLRDAARLYNIPLTDWVDLSTGINPNGWLPKNMPDEIWNRLPEENDDLINAAQTYYGCDVLLPVAGSQAAIQALPQILFKENGVKKNIGVLRPAYAEHAYAWKKSGHNVIPLTSDQIKTCADKKEETVEKEENLDALIIVNPNNPTGETLSPEILTEWHETLAKKNGWLIIDEAFMDCTPENSMLTKMPRNNVIILRSIGKFFGLAGIRVGFVAAPPTILTQMDEALGPWTISGPSRLCALQALRDQEWQTSNTAYLKKASQRLTSLLKKAKFSPTGSTHLFCWVKTENAACIHQALANEGILTRLFDTPKSIRFGLPKNEQQWQRLTAALKKITRVG